jgi:hypothetical protein
MAELSKALSAGVQFQFDGRTYTLPAICLDHWAQFEAWLEQQAAEGVERAFRECAPAVYREALKVVSENIPAQTYGFGGEVFARATKSYNGVKRLFIIVIHDSHPEWDDDKVNDFIKAKGIGEVVRLVNAASAE